MIQTEDVGPVVQNQWCYLLTQLHLEWPTLYGVLAILSAIGLKRCYIFKCIVYMLPFLANKIWKAFALQNSTNFFSMKY